MRDHRHRHDRCRSAAHRARRKSTHRMLPRLREQNHAHTLRKTREQTRTNGLLLLSPPPLHARRPSDTENRHAVRSTRAYTRAPQSVFFFRLHPFTHLPQVIRNQHTMGEGFAIFSFTAFFSEIQNRKTIVILAKQNRVNCRFSSVPPAVKENTQSLHPKRSIVQRVTYTR